MFKSFRTRFDEYRQVLAYSDPIQAARIEAAAVKRARKADKLHEWACRSRHYNVAHTHGQAAFLTQRLDPLFVIHS